MGLEEAFELGVEVLLVGGGGAARGLEVDACLVAGVAFADEREAESVALAVQQLDEYCSCVGAEGELVGAFYVTLSFKWEEHGGAVVDDYLAAEVGLFLELFDVKAVGAPKEAPVDVTGGLAGVVLAVVGELDGESVEGAFMFACDEALDYLACEEVEGFVSGDL